MGAGTREATTICVVNSVYAPGITPVTLVGG